ncbi:hypothetical protein AVEN_256431-1 [Araneus ventricosus]|uniref:Uncharacterized protein n=1 Tax=Araneus ventricosus TaxID=182803 RepID=A0A4Y2K177_ARAVE|nr:hypothetical protein AVEN_256431-1 [Araneus ventricosus]
MVSALGRLRFETDSTKIRFNGPLHAESYAVAKHPPWCGVEAWRGASSGSPSSSTAKIASVQISRAVVLLQNRTLIYTKLAQLLDCQPGLLDKIRV